MSNSQIQPVWRWGKATPWIATLFFLVLGSLIIAIVHARGEQFFHQYTICLGYFVAWSIAQSHYFKVKPDKPYVKGLLIYPLIIILAIMAYNIGNAVFSAVGVPVTFGHFTFIMLGFFIFGLDDFVFGGRLSKWLKSDFLRFLFWCLVIIIAWIFLFSFVLKEEVHFWQFFGMFQWPIVCLLAYALLIRVPGKTLSFGRQLRNFILLFVFGFVSAYHYKSCNLSWHSVLNIGTFPLLPIIIHGLYFERWPSDSNPILNQISRIFIRIIILLVAYRIQWILFVVIIAGKFGPEGIHISDALALQWCFTVAILPLAHFWFTKFWGFKKVVTQ